MIGGGRIKSVPALTGSWDAERPTDGANTPFLTFEAGAFQSDVNNGYGHFDSDKLCGWMDEIGHVKNPGKYGAARQRLGRVSAPDEKTALKSARNYGGAEFVASRCPASSREPCPH
jgi:phthalate 4,5-cis-dihydrodiol dehydrogenase